VLTRTSTLIVIVTLVALAGCGGSSKSPSPTSAPASSAPSASTPTTPPSGATSAGPLSVAADPGGQLKFDASTLTAKAGHVSIKFTNSSPVAHNLTIESSGGQTLGATPTFSGGSKSLSVTLKPGTYTFFCSVPGHRAAGMSGTLTVQ
jgi:plastocyanin